MAVWYQFAKSDAKYHKNDKERERVTPTVDYVRYIVYPQGDKIPVPGLDTYFLSQYESYVMLLETSDGQVLKDFSAISLETYYAGEQYRKRARAFFNELVEFWQLVLNTDYTGLLSEAVKWPRATVESVNFQAQRPIKPWNGFGHKIVEPIYLSIKVSSRKITFYDCDRSGHGFELEYEVGQPLAILAASKTKV